MLNCHTKGLTGLTTSDKAIYAISSGKFLNVRVNACVKDLTNIMSEYICISIFCSVIIRLCGIIV